MDADPSASSPKLRPSSSPAAEKHSHAWPPLVSGFFAHVGRYVRNLNFIKLHYIYIALLSITASVALYANQNNLRYIDALFFAMSACSQGGLNPVDVNKLNTWQQVVLYMLPHLSSPIVMHTAVVFVRLYYFEKEFHGIRKRSKLQSKYRRSLSHTRTIYRGEEPKKSILQRALSPLLPSYFRGSSATMINSQGSANGDTMRNTLSNMDPNTRFPTADVDMESGDGLRRDSVNHGKQLVAKYAAPPPLANRAIAFTDPVRPSRASPDAAADSLGRLGASLLLENARSGDITDTSKHQKRVLPSDIAHSISLMENRNKSVPGNEDDKGPALVIRRPQDIEEEEARAQHPHRRRKDRAHKRGNIYLRETSTEEHGEGPVEEPFPQSTVSAHATEQEKRSFDFPLARLTKFSFTGNGSSPQLPASDFDSKTAVVNEREICGRDPKDSKDALSKDGEASTSGRNSNNDSTVLPQIFFTAPTRTTSMDSDAPSLNLRRVMSADYLSWQPTVEGNSVFVNLTDDQKEELGGVEYRALKLLAKILVCYYVGWNVTGMTVLMAWGVHANTYREMFRQIAVERGWWGVFTAGSAFCNVGLTLTPDSMVSFSTSLCVLIFLPFFMIIGNTGFPVFLRFTIWIMFKLTDPYGRMHESLGFLLDHPRRCFTLLFPSDPTWWLLGVVLALNLTDTVLFLILDLDNPAVTVLPVVYRILAGFFQAVSTRTTGFAILNTAALHPAVLVSYTIMMYINIFPIAMSVRHTNVYEEQTLGLYRPPTLSGGAPPENSSAKKISDVSMHLMRQLSYDLWFLFIALFIVCICEEGKIVSETNGIPIFNILFELTSAYGTVGLSMGYPGVNVSLSGEFSVVGKLVVIAVLYRGRHRSLPYAIDRAIMLPSKKMQASDLAEELMVARRPSSHAATPTLLSRTTSTLSAHGPPPRVRTPHPHARRTAQSVSSFGSSSDDGLSGGRSRDSDADDEGEEDDDYEEDSQRRGDTSSYSDKQPRVSAPLAK